MRFRPVTPILCSILSSVLKHTPVEAKPVSMEGAVLHVRLGLYWWHAGFPGLSPVWQNSLNRKPLVL